MMQYYDGKVRPSEDGKWSKEEFKRICLNCGKRFGKHFVYNCPIDE